jgi:hypothetical protein
MLAIFLARAFNLARRHLAALLFKAARLAFFAALCAFHHGVLNKRLLYEAIELSSALNHFAFFIPFGSRLRRRRRNRP